MLPRFYYHLRFSEFYQHYLEHNTALRRTCGVKFDS